MPSGSRPNPPAHVIHAVLSGNVNGTYPWANVLWLRNGNATTPNAEDLTTAAGEMFDTYGANLGPNLVGNWHLTKCELLYYGPTGAELGAVHSGSTGGGASGLPASMNVACCVSWTVSERYKGGHPRSYLAGVSLGALADPTTFESEFCTDVRDGANNFHAGANSISVGDLTDVHMGTVSFVHANAWRSPPVFRDFIPGAAAVDTRIDSMRRRLGRDR